MRPSPDLLHLPLIIPPQYEFIGVFRACFWHGAPPVTSGCVHMFPVSCLFPDSYLPALVGCIVCANLSGFVWIKCAFKTVGSSFQGVKINFHMLIQGGTCPGFKSPWRPAAVGQLAMHVSKKAQQSQITGFIKWPTNDIKLFLCLKKRIFAFDRGSAADFPPLLCNP